MRSRINVTVNVVYTDPAIHKTLETRDLLIKPTTHANRHMDASDFGPVCGLVGAKKLKNA